MGQHYLFKLFRKKYITGTIITFILIIVAVVFTGLLVTSEYDLPSISEVSSNSDIIGASGDEEQLVSLTVTNLVHNDFVVEDEDGKIILYDFFAEIEETGEPVIVSLRADKISEEELTNPPASYKIWTGFVYRDWDYNASLAQEFFEGDLDQFQEVYTGEIVEEINMFMIMVSDSGYIWIGGILTILALLAFLYNLINIFTVKGCKPYREFKKIAGDLERNLDSIDREIRDGSPTKVGKILISKSWLINEQYYVVRLEDVIWVYNEEIAHYRNGIHTGTSHKGQLGLKNGKIVRAYDTYKKDVTHLFLETMPKVCPYAVYGFSPELKKMFKDEREKIIAVVDERRQEAGVYENTNTGYNI
ncbi:MAG: hypothetical protein LBV33_05540 [Lachnospiraceae bacterium]|jgi:hypothetical protein|nr:hypothetical protein [Lachnospiraceae bacterium]